MAKGDTKTNQYLDIAANGTRADLPTDTCCETRSQTLIREVAERIMDVEDEVEELKNNPDVVDIVATYADLQAYDAQHLTDKDIIRVLQDETHDGESTYYRYNKQSDTWTYVGTVGDYYTKTAADAKFQDKLTAGSNITISDQNVISATDTTYSNFTGTDGTAAGTAGLVPAPTTTDGDKYLKGDGTWGTVQAGSSYTAGDGIDITNDVISATNTGKAKVLTSADYNYPTTGTKTSVALWLLEPGIYTKTDSSVTVRVSSQGTMPVGATAVVGRSTGFGTPIIYLNADYISDIGNTAGTVYVIGSIGNVLNSWRLAAPIDKLTSTEITIPLSANQGKVLKDLADSLAIRAAGAPTTSTAGQVGTLYEDTTNGKLYICTDATNPYVWEEVGGGSGPTVVQTTGTSTTDVMSQNAVTNLIFKYRNGASVAYDKIVIGDSYTTTTTAGSAVVIGNSGDARYPTTVGSNSNGGIALGGGARVANNSADGIAVGLDSYATAASSIALGALSVTTQKGQVDISTLRTPNTYGYNNSQYRLLTGLYDPQTAHDAATKGYVDANSATLLTNTQFNTILENA